MDSMNMSANGNDSGDTFDTIEISLPRSVRFWILILFDIPSVICSFILLIYLFGNRKARCALNNHVIILLIIFGLGTELIDVPFYLSFIINSGIVKPSIPAICLIWWFVAFCLYNGVQILMAWASIERHLLIFNDSWMRTKRGMFLGHYFPLIVILCYIFIFYIYVLFIFNCANTYAYNLPVCNAYPCYQDNSILGIWDFSVNNLLPGFLVAFISIALLIRVIRKKQSLNQQIQWSKYRKMTIQLLSISILNIIFILPLNLLSLAYLCGLPQEYGAQIELYFYFAGYLFIFLIPFVSLASLPELWKKVKLTFLCRRRNTAGTQNLPTTRITRQ
jgi:hypothetical protein